MNRQELQENYIQQLIEGMDFKTMECFVYDTLKENLSTYTDEELITEVEEYYPELIEGWLFMSKFLIGVVVGIVLSTVGFNGIASLGNRAVHSIETFASQNQWRDLI